MGVRKKNKQLKTLSILIVMSLISGCSATTVEVATTEEDIDVAAYIEIHLQEYELELTSDATPEKLQLYLLGNEGDDVTKAEYLVEDKVRQILVRVTDGTNADNILYERKFSHTHFENGQLLVLQKDGEVRVGPANDCNR